MYIGFNMLLLLKVPSPSVVQSIVAALFTEAFCIWFGPSHIFPSGPASTSTFFSIVNNVSAVTGAQDPLPVASIVNVAPFVTLISNGPGI